MAEFEPDPNRPLRVVGRYALYGKLASGGMATVHFGRLLGPVGFSRTVAIKRLHPQFAKDPEFVAMFLDEARLAARIQHPNVVATVDVVAMEEELFLVMDYIRGESLSRLLRGAKRLNLDLPEGFVANVVACMLHGLHAAHEATDERGQPLAVVHRDVSPQNVLVGIDGVARVLDFGVAKAAARVQVTRDGQMKGKLAYMSPEQLSGVSVDRRSDVFAAGVVLWEALTGERLFTGDDASEVLTKILREPVRPPSSVNPKVRREIDAVALRALDKNPNTRFQSAREFAVAVEEAMQLMSPRSVGEWVERIAGESLEKRERALAEIESISSVNELSSVTPSDPGFMKTLKTQVRGRPITLPLRPPTPGRAPPPPRAQSEQEEAATTIYHGVSAGLSPLPPADATIPAVIVNPIGGADAQLNASVIETSSVEENPFRQRKAWMPHLIWGGGGMVVVALLYFIVAAFSSVGDRVVEPLRPIKQQPQAKAMPAKQKEVPELEASELPLVDDETTAATTEAPPSRKPAARDTANLGSSEPSKGVLRS
jgi:eukaryotic-like serine/threonine-protein kinase